MQACRSESEQMACMNVIFCLQSKIVKKFLKAVKDIHRNKSIYNCIWSQFNLSNGCFQMNSLPFQQERKLTLNDVNRQRNVS